MPCWPKVIPWLAADNLLTGRLSNLEHLRNESRFEFQQVDINEPFDCGAVDYVFHFASPASPVDYAVHGIATLQGRLLWALFTPSKSRHKYGAKYHDVVDLGMLWRSAGSILRQKPTGAT